MTGSYSLFPYGREADNVLADLNKLTAAGDYSFLKDLRHVIEHRELLKIDDPLRAQLFDPIRKELAVKRVDLYLRRALRDGARPEPWVVLRQKRVEFLGRQPDLSRFQLGIFWLLCETPQEPVERAYIKESCNLNCELENIKSHVTRLKDRLRPAVEARFNDGTRPKHADDAFIHGRRTHLGPYQLMLDASYVVVIEPRPDFMVRVPRVMHQASTPRRG